MITLPCFILPTDIYFLCFVSPLYAKHVSLVAPSCYSALAMCVRSFKFGHTALMLAAMKGHDKIVDVLIKAGADKDVTDMVSICT